MGVRKLIEMDYGMFAIIFYTSLFVRFHVSSCDSMPVGEGKQRVSLVMIYLFILLFLSFFGFENEHGFCSENEMKGAESEKSDL